MQHVSGESTARPATASEALDRAFGDTAVCNVCEERTPGYRVIAQFLHDTVAVRAYCPACYPRIEGEYHARGDGFITDYNRFSRRFGSPGPPPPPATRVNRILLRLLGVPDLRRLVPASEALAKRALAVPYAFDIGLQTGGEIRGAMLALEPDGSVASLQGEPQVCDRIRTILAAR